MDGAKAQQQEDEAVGALSPNFLAETHLPDTKEEAIDVTIHMEDGSALASEESTIRHDARRISWFGFKARLRAATASTRVHISPDTESLDSVELGSISPSTSTAIVSPVSVEGLAQNAGGDIEAAKQDKGPTPTAESAAGYLGRLLQTYSDSLERRPVLTKAISSGLIGLLGDLAAQSIEWSFKGFPAPWSGSQAIWRSCAVMLDGFFVNGPLLHYAYEALEKYLPAEESVLLAIMQVGVDIFVIDPVFAFLFVWSTGLIEGRSVRKEILKTIEHSYPEMVGWLILIGLCWAPVQIYLFNRYPVKFRVLVADLIDLVWTCVTSFFCHV